MNSKFKAILVSIYIFFLRSPLFLLCLAVGLKGISGLNNPPLFGPFQSVAFNLSQPDHGFSTLINGRVERGKLKSETAGHDGPVLMEDVNLRQELSHFNRERIPERVVHALGSGAHGFFEPDPDSEIRKYTKAKVFNGPKVPIVVRVSIVNAGKGTADTLRDIRGFAVKFKTIEGNWDFVGINFPVFPIRDAARFVSLAHALKPDPRNNLMNPNNVWDFISLLPETLHTVSYLFSDLGTPYSYRFINAFGINTFKLVNQKGEVHYARWQFMTDQGIRNFTNSQAMKIAGTHPEWAAKDFFDSIEKKNFPSWTMFVQVLSPHDLNKFKFNPLDATKIWPTSQVPLIKVGRIVLNRNPKNYFAEVEQLAFNPENLVSGMEPSPDKVLQGRLFGEGSILFFMMFFLNSTIQISHLNLQGRRSSTIEYIKRCESLDFIGLTEFNSDGLVNTDINQNRALAITKKLAIVYNCSILERIDCDADFVIILRMKKQLPTLAILYIYLKPSLSINFGGFGSRLKHIARGACPIIKAKNKF